MHRGTSSLAPKVQNKEKAGAAHHHATSTRKKAQQSVDRPAGWGRQSVAAGLRRMGAKSRGSPSFPDL